MSATILSMTFAAVAASMASTGVVAATADDKPLPPCCAARAAEAEIALGDAGDNDPAHELLAELEASAADLQAFTADVNYIHEENLLGRREIRSGEIIYRVDPVDRSKSFAILFNRLIVGDRAQSQQKHYIFAGRWLAEVDHANRQFISREIVPPGRDFDPLKLGEGPIPLPIGQPKDEVLARFDVTLIEQPPQDGPLRGLDNVDGIRLVPKQGTAEARDYQHVDLYYDRTTRLPVGIETLETNDDRKIVRLLNVQHNPQLTDEQLQQLSIEVPDAQEWAIDVRPWRGNN